MSTAGIKIFLIKFRKITIAISKDNCFVYDNLIRNDQQIICWSFPYMLKFVILLIRSSKPKTHHYSPYVPYGL